VKGAIAIAACAVSAVVLAAAPPAARADGDPASDMLLIENVFYPFSPPVAPALERTLNAETAAAKRAHFPIKVALIASPTDLGAIPSLFAKPQQYADFLDQEISFGGKQLLLVVMPNGYGMQGLTPSGTAAAAKLAPPAGRASDDLARAAIVAVAKLAAAAGHPVAGIPGASGAGGGGGGGGSGGGAAAVGVGLLAFLAVVASAGVLSFRHRRARAR